MSKCPIPRITDIWSKPMKKISRDAPRVAYTIPVPNQQWGQLENEESNSLPPVNYELPKKFVKAPNGCVSTQFMRNRLYEVNFPYSYVKIKMSKNVLADEVDRYGGYNFTANYYGNVKHHGPFGELILEEKEGWANPGIPTMQISMPVMLFCDDPEVWMDVLPSDRNVGKNLPITTIPGFMPIHSWSRGLSWAFEWQDLNQEECLLNHDVIMFNLLFSKPVKLEYVPWNETFSQQWNLISQSSVNRRETNMLYPEALSRRPSKLLPRKQKLWKDKNN